VIIAHSAEKIPNFSSKLITPKITILNINNYKQNKKKRNKRKEEKRKRVRTIMPD